MEKEYSDIDGEEGRLDLSVIESVITVRKENEPSENNFIVEESIIIRGMD